MIIEFTAAAALVYGYNYLKDSGTRKIKKKWEETLQACKADGIRNKNDETFKISAIYKRKYGYWCNVTIPRGCSADALMKAKDILQDNLNCLIEFEKERFKDYISVKIIDEILEFEYAPVKTNSNELFLGYKLDGSHYKLDINKDPHILIAGKTGTGKSFLFAMILTNLIYNNKRDIDIYLLQKMKGEIDIFKDCPSVKFTSDNPSEILVILKKLIDIIHKRSKQFAACGIKNINQWNTTFPNKKMKRIIIGAEELSFFMYPGSKDEENPFFHFFNDIVKAGRSAGVHFIGLIQRTTAANLGGNGELKSQLTVITAKQRSELDSRNAIDINDAAYLESQEFICSGNDGYVTFKAPTIDEDFKILNKYVPEIKVPGVEPKEKPQVEKKSRILSIEETAKLRENYLCMPLEEYRRLEESKTGNRQQNKILPVGTRRPGAVKVGVNNGADR